MKQKDHLRGPGGPIGGACNRMIVGGGLIQNVRKSTVRIC